MKDEKVKLYHTVPRILNHSTQHILESAEAPPRRVVVVSPKQRAKYMKQNAHKNIAMRERLSKESANPSVFAEEQAFRDSIKGGIEEGDHGSSSISGLGKNISYIDVPIVHHHPSEAPNAR